MLGALVGCLPILEVTNTLESFKPIGTILTNTYIYIYINKYIYINRYTNICRPTKTGSYKHTHLKTEVFRPKVLKDLTRCDGNGFILRSITTQWLQWLVTTKTTSSARRMLKLYKIVCPNLLLGFRVLCPKSRSFQGMISKTQKNKRKTTFRGPWKFHILHLAKQNRQRMGIQLTVLIEPLPKCLTRVSTNPRTLDFDSGWSVARYLYNIRK